MARVSLDSHGGERGLSTTMTTTITWTIKRVSLPAEAARPKHVLTACPRGPGRPTTPDAPGTPGGPVPPCRPGCPRRPCSPGPPGVPLCPGGPRSPCGPCGPRGPASPGGPPGPRSPAAPRGPDGPGNPCDPGWKTMETRENVSCSKYFGIQHPAFSTSF